MTDNKRETGARVPKSDLRPGATDQNAGMPENPGGAGLSRHPDDTDERTHQSDQADTMEGSPEGDAKGAYAKPQHGGSNDGVVSADPRVLSGKKSGDATFKHTFKGIDRE
ncbi:hypothetical protein PZ895_14085 [Mesorhizobium sp. YIM 152430]|uniref:hypothetical protein n=1 Tax=Mesorhizobium sp. YIM 152430 TaxID=3031761 RepID=UPI0023DB3E45|nr:hypothetical protein [Mesorhizobium sp. YIM 152430]MDF1600892.1 hypothetical protein [Mesorhizobium sp. YIM 152430]